MCRATESEIAHMKAMSGKEEVHTLKTRENPKRDTRLSGTASTETGWHGGLPDEVPEEAL